MSLPYPSMAFVPLDVLTAEEMNQLVANIESLSGTLKRVYCGAAAIAETGQNAWHFGYVSVPAGVFTTTPYATANYASTAIVPPSITYVRDASSPTQLVFGVWSNSAAVPINYIAIEQ